MTSEEEIIISFVFNRSGKKEMLFSEFYLTLSMDLNWFTPDDAKNFSNNLIKNKLLTKTKETVKPGFDTSKIKVPLGFYPSKQALEKKESETKIIEEDLFTNLLNEIISKTGKNEEKILEKIRSIEKEKNLTKEIAALLIAKEHDIDLKNCYEEIEEKIIGV